MTRSRIDPFTLQPLWLFTVVAFVGGGMVGVWASHNRHISPSHVDAELQKSTPTSEPQPRQYRTAHWPQIEGESIDKLAADLKAIGCPSQTIAYIVRGYLYYAYDAELSSVFDPLARYWSSQEDQDAAVAKIEAIEKERDRKLASLKLGPTGEFSVTGLSLENQQHVAEALQKFPKIELSVNATADDWRQFMQNRAERVRYLAQYLSPEELLSYRMTQDGNAEAIARLLNAIHPSNQEFRNVFAALDGRNLNQVNGKLSPDLEAMLQSALGNQRYAEYQAQQTPANFYYNNFVLSFHLTDDQIQQLNQVRESYQSMTREDYQHAVSQIVQDPSGVSRYFLIPRLYDPKAK